MIIPQTLSAPCREFIITGTKAGAKSIPADMKEEPAANGTKAAANGKAGAFIVCGDTLAFAFLNAAVIVP